MSEYDSRAVKEAMLELISRTLRVGMEAYPADVRDIVAKACGLNPRKATFVCVVSDGLNVLRDGNGVRADIVSLRHGDQLEVGDSIVQIERTENPDSETIMLSNPADVVETGGDLE